MNSTQRYLAGQIAAKVFAAATFVVLARLVPKPAVGRFVSALLFASLLAVVIDFGASQTAVRLSATESFHAPRPFLHPRVLVCRVLVGLGLGLALALRGLSLGPLAGLSIALGASLALNAFNEGQFLGAGLGGLAAATNVLSNAVTLAAALAIGLFANRHATAAMIVAAYGLGAVSANTWYALAARRQPRPSASGSAPSEVRSPQNIRQRRLVGSFNLTNFLYYRADLLTLTFLASGATVAVYAAAYRIFEVIPILLQLAGTARQPGAAREIADGSPAQAARHTYTGMVFLVLGLAAPLLAAGPIAVSLLYGRAYRAARVVLPLLIAGGLGQSISISAYTCVASAGTLDRSRVPLLIITMTSVPILVAAVVTGHHFLGLPGVALAQSAVEILFGVSLTVLVSSEFRIWHGTGSWPVRRSIVFFLAALATVALSIRFTPLSLLVCAALAVVVVARRKPLLRIARTW